ncbi:MAG: hypothetical protein M1826_005954 [Phylliscum demangeonii]|nr:MAG: hypothetical protein M1826_005954 [Phylliscum demangeonii]
MATHAPRPVARRPFAALDASCLQRLQSVKNRQNAWSSSPELNPSTKRRHDPAEFDGDDTENVDPIASASAAKRTKAGLDDDSTLAKSMSMSSTPTCDVLSTQLKPHFVLANAPSTPMRSSFAGASLTRPMPKSSSARISKAAVKGWTSPSPMPTGAGITKKHASISISTSTSAATSASRATPVAGRSPKHKRIGVLSRRRIASPFTRIDPPTAKLLDASPLSIDAALSGTLSHYRARSSAAAAAAPATPPRPTVTLEQAPMKASWFFDVYEDTADDTLTNIMEFSTGNLDISDDEDRRREKDERGKENIPPDMLLLDADTHARAQPSAVAATPTLTLTTTTTTVPSVKTPPLHHPMKPGQTAESRAPLADLPPTDFYDVSPLNDAALTVDVPTDAVPGINAVLQGADMPWTAGDVSSEEKMPLAPMVEQPEEKDGDDGKGEGEGEGERAQMNNDINVWEDKDGPETR